ncbi:GHKL domain-containing protein [Nitrogeniibacter mangrovi]|uniref:histidine kinase n=1 Tax=Nitrogeniibacter mangrovi TaxID=2016596 RepID=A0A6C1B5J1_9RHOO|nr:ATP-binding protein [Nitrogeniibacter mangrovi]QID18309.1 GHKL domain-containing protein [Nitrogeniibacter mangrovi]
MTVGVGAGLYSFLEAYKEAQELQDHTLIQIGSLLSITPVAIATAAHLPAFSEDPESQLVIVSAQDSAPSHHVPFKLAGAQMDGIQTLPGDGENWRVYVTTSEEGDLIAVGQRTAVRDEQASDAALRIVLALVLLTPILLLVIQDLIRKSFTPLEDLAKAVEARHEQDLTPVGTDGMFEEVRPFVVAINRLLARVGGFVGAQKRFVADAAHELRSPLTALSLQAERLAQARMSDEAKERLETLRSGIGRSRALLEQMLTFARVQDSDARTTESVSVRAAVTRAIEDLLPQADAKQIDLGAGTVCEAQVPIAPFDFSTLVKNLLENAIRYTPAGGNVDIAAHTDASLLTLTVKDSGPGIPPEDREKVFEPFHRLLGSKVDGSGLGLSIVKSVVDRHQGTIHLSYADPEREHGLRVDVHFRTPVPPPGASPASTA